MFEDLFFEFPKVASILFIFAGCESLCRMRAPGLYFPHLALAAAQTHRTTLLLWLLKWIALVLLTLALMSPVKEERYTITPPPGYHITLIVDASQSMNSNAFDTTDVNRSRFDVVKSVIDNFIEARRGDAIGLVVFGKDAYVAAPLTLQTTLLRDIVEHLYIAMAGQFTALYEATAQGVDLLRRSGEGSRIAILLTDGHNTPGGVVPPEVAMALAVREKVRLYTIGIGDPGGYDADVLQQMADLTGGEHFGARDTAALVDVYAAINRLEKHPLPPPPVIVKRYYYVYPLFLGFLVLLMYVHLRNRRSDG